MTFAVIALLLLIIGVTMQRRTVNASEPMAFTAAPEKQAEIKFDTLRHDFGTFSEKDGEQHCSFQFTNVGNAPLIINQAFASCGCTAPSYTKDPVQPGDTALFGDLVKHTGKVCNRRLERSEEP